MGMMPVGMGSDRASSTTKLKIRTYSLNLRREDITIDLVQGRDGEARKGTRREVEGTDDRERREGQVAEDGAHDGEGAEEASASARGTAAADDREVAEDGPEDGSDDGERGDGQAELRDRNGHSDGGKSEDRGELGEHVCEVVVDAVSSL